MAGGWRLAAGGKAAAYLLALVWHAGVPASEQDPARDAEPSLREYARASQFRCAFGIYMEKRKLGWMTLASRLGEHEGKEVLWTLVETEMRVAFAGEKSRIETKEQTARELDGEGAILFSESTASDNGAMTRTRVVRDGEGMTVTRKSRSGETSRRVPIPRDTLAEQRRFESWLAAEPAVGASLDVHSSDWEEDDVNQLERNVYQGKRQVFWGGVMTEVCVVAVEMKGATAECEFLPDGKPIRFRFGGFLEVRIEEVAKAKDLSDEDQVDMLQASAVKIGKDLGDPRQVDSLTLRASGLGDFRLPESSRQRVRAASPGSATIEIRREGKADDPVPLEAQEREKYLLATNAIPSDHQAIRDQARKIAGEATDPLPAATALSGWVHRNLKKTMTTEAMNALDVLHALKGDCTEHTLLFVALARAAGIPAREVSGLVYAGNEPEPFLGWHAWAEVHDGSRWVSVDPTWGQVRVDATHLKVSDDQDDWSWFNVLGQLKLEVLEFERRD